VINITIQINHKQLENLIVTYYQKNMPLFVHGTFGIGKSQSFLESSKRLAKELNLEFSDNIKDINDESKFILIDIRCSEMDSVDIRGLPHFEGEGNGKKTKWFTPNWLPIKGQGIIFLDEFNLAPPLVQKSMYELIYDKRLIGGQYMLPKGYSIFCAGNLDSDKSDIFNMAYPLLNRLAHVELSIPSIEEFTSWSIENELDSRLIAFLQDRPSLLHRFETNLKDKAMPTPRTYEFCSNLIKGVKDIDEIRLMASSVIGEGTATELHGFLKLQRNVDIKEIIANPESINDITEIDLKYAVVSRLSDEFRKEKKIFEPLMKVCKYMQPEFSVLLLKFMVKQCGKSDFLKRMKKSKAWNEISAKYTNLVYPEG